MSNRLPAARPREAITSLPAKLDLTPVQGEAHMRIIAGLGALGAAALVYLQIGRLAPPGTPAALFALAVPLVLAATGLVTLLGGVRRQGAARQAEFDGDGVTVTGRSRQGIEEWSAPYAEFDGVQWRSVTLKRRGDQDSARVLQVLELRHPDPERSLTLLVRPGRESIRDEWEAVARVLGVSAIDARDGADQVRAVEDLDKNVRELAAEGKAAVTWDPEAAPPPGLAYASDGEGKDGQPAALTVRILARRHPVWLYALIGAVGAGLVVTGVYQLSIWELLFGLVLAAGTPWIWRQEMQNPRKLRVTRSEIVLFDSDMANPTTLPHAAIEEIRVAPPKDIMEQKGVIVIRSDSGEIRTGAGLSSEALAWLRGFLLAAVVEA